MNSTLNIPNMEQDFFGYWNHKVSNTSMIPTEIGAEVGEPAGNRSSDEKYMQANMLEAIVYPTGGITKFTYEMNRMADIFTAGLRIRSITNFDRDRKFIGKREFRYGKNESGLGRHTSLDYFSTGTLYKYYQFTRVPVNGDKPELELFPVYSASAAAISGAGGTPVFYDHVTEYLSNDTQNLGKTEYEFDFVQDGRHYEPESRLNYIYSQPPGIPIPTYNQYSFMFFDRSWARGQLLSTKTYSFENGTYLLKKEKKNRYAVFGQRKRVLGPYLDVWAVDPEVHSPSFHDLLLEDIFMETGLKLLVGSNEISYDGGTTSDSTSYFYDNLDHFQPSRIERFTSDGNKKISKTLYAADFKNMTATDRDSKNMSWMNGRNIRTLPIEQALFLQRGTAVPMLISSALNTFKENSILPDRIFQIEDAGNATTFAMANALSGKFQKDPGYREIAGFDTYTKYAKIAQQHERLRKPEVYLWAYKGQYPVARITGSDYISVGKKIDVNSLMETGNEASIRNLINQLRNAYRDSSVQIQSFLYQPEIGIKEETDPASKTVTMGYDQLGRMVSKADYQGYLLQSFAYNYSNAVFSYNRLPDWQPTGNTRCIKNDFDNQNTGQKAIEKRDLNIFSESYNQVSWNFTETDATSCPLPAVFNSKPLSQLFYKNNCPAGSVGDSIWYNIPMGKYKSTVSQADADQKAVNDMNANGQSYANANANCIQKCGLAADNGFTIYSQDFTTSGSTVNIPQFTVIINQYSGSVTIDFKIGTVTGPCLTGKSVTKNFSAGGNNWVLTISGNNVYLRAMNSFTPGPNYSLMVPSITVN